MVFYLIECVSIKFVLNAKCFVQSSCQGQEGGGALSSLGCTVFSAINDLNCTLICRFGRAGVADTMLMQ